LFLIDWLRVTLRLRGRTPPDLRGLPDITDERVHAAVQIMSDVAKAAYQVRPELCVAVSTKAVGLCLKHGNTPDSAIAYMVFGCVFLGGVMGRHRRGAEYGLFALDLIDKYQNEERRAEVEFVVGYFGTSWIRPAEDAERLWASAYSAGLASNDLFHTGCAAAGTMMSLWMRGEPMDVMRSRADEYLSVLRPLHLSEPIAVIESIGQATRNLRGQTSHSDSFSDDRFDEAAHVEALANFGSRHFVHFHYLLRMHCMYLWGDVEAALVAVGRARAYLVDVGGMLHFAEHHVLEALIHAAGCLRSQRSPGAPGAPRAAEKRIVKNHAMLARWARNNPANFLAKERLVAAELARVRNEIERSRACYAEAIEASRSRGNLWMEGVSCLRAAGLEPRAPERHEPSVLEAQGIAALHTWGAAADAVAKALTSRSTD
jgi:hypothetical protein